MRRLRSTMVACLGIAAVLASNWSAAAQQGDKARGALSERDETALRTLVSKNVLATRYWSPKKAKPNDPTARFRVLCLPVEVGEIYSRNPLGTLRTLKQIVLRGSAPDGHTAIAYAHAAVGYAAEDPVELIYAFSYAYYPTAKEFDQLHPVVAMTYRQVAVEQVDKLLARVEKERASAKAKKG